MEMAPERAAGGGWEAAIDAGLAARLLRPAVRAGISDPAHGPPLAGRVPRPSAPPWVPAIPLRPSPETSPPVPGDGPAPAAQPVVSAALRATGPLLPPVH